MSRIALLVIILFASAFIAFAAPVPYPDTSYHQLDKRVDHLGHATWFHVGEGNCGATSVDGDPVVAIAKSRYDSNGGANCNQWVEIINVDNGNKAIGQLLDSCQSCGDTDIDLSPSLFQQLDALSVGELNVKWHFKNPNWRPYK